MATEFGGTTLTPDLPFRDILRGGGVVANYNAHYDGQTRSWHIGTLKEKPSKQSIAAGKAFAADTKGYVNSWLFTMPQSEADTGAPAAKITSGFRFHHVTGIALNGHEPRSFLVTYQKYMAEKAEKTRSRLERLRELQAPDTILQTNERLLSGYSSSAKRAQALL